MRLAGHGKKVLSLAIAAAMAVSVCTTGWAVEPGSSVGSQVQGAQTSESATPENAGSISMGDKTFDTLYNAMAAIEAGSNVTITLNADITLEKPVDNVPAATITIVGNGKKIDVTKANKAFTNNTISPEGLLPGTNLTVQNVQFVSETEDFGHAVIMGSKGGSSVTLDGCTFKNLHDAVYANVVTDTSAADTSVTIKNSTFENVTYTYGWDNGATAGALTNKHHFDLMQNNTGIENLQPETFEAAKIGDVGYRYLNDAIKAANGATITLQKDVTENVNVPAAAKATLDLNGKTLTMTNTTSVALSEGASLTIQNGTIVATNIPNGTKALFNVLKDSSIYLKSVSLDTTGAALFPQGDAATVNVTDSTIEAGTYAVATNAATVANYNVKINLKNSTFSTPHGYQNGDNDVCTVMINVPGTMNVDNCTIMGGRQAVLVRGGTASIKDSTIINTGKYSPTNKYLDGIWGSGNEVPMAALVVGNREKENGTGYKNPSTCTVENTTITSQNGAVPAIYTYGMDEEGRNVTLTISGENTKVQGVISNNGVAKTTVSAGYYTNEVPADLINDESKACNLLGEKYEGIYGYQVSEKVAPEAVEVEVSVAEPTVQENENISITGSDITVEAKDVEDAAKAIDIADSSKVDVMIAAKNQATLKGKKLDSEDTLNAAVAALKKANESIKLGDKNSDVTILVEPKLSITPKAAEATSTAKSMTFDIKLVYDVKATTDPQNQVLSNNDTSKINTVYLDQGVEMPKAPTMNIKLGGLSAIEISQNDATKVYVQHDHEGTLHYYKPIEIMWPDGSYVDSLTFTNPNGFSTFKAYLDTRYAQIKLGNDTIPVTPDKIGSNIASMSKPGYTFQGLNIEGISGTQLVLTDDLLTKLSDLYNKGSQKAIAATAVFTENQTGDNSTTTENTTSSSTTTTTQSGSNITYYTCPACGYHDWTATAEGYKCNHCGYVESVKQLSGYGNVKGVYEPKTSAAAAAASGNANATATSAIPQTSDELPLTALVVVAVVALLGLGVTVVLKKRSNR